jgi:excisionase family DNA binding protein
MIKGVQAKIVSPSFFENLDERWLSTNDVAKFLSVSPNAVRIMVCRRIIPAHRLRGRLRFRKRDCIALLSKRGA